MPDVDVHGSNVIAYPTHKGEFVTSVDLHGSTITLHIT